MSWKSDFDFCSRKYFNLQFDALILFVHCRRWFFSLDCCYRKIKSIPVNLTFFDCDCGVIMFPICRQNRLWAHSRYIYHFTLGQVNTYPNIACLKILHVWRGWDYRTGIPHKRRKKHNHNNRKHFESHILYICDTPCTHATQYVGIFKNKRQRVQRRIRTYRNYKSGNKSAAGKMRILRSGLGIRAVPYLDCLDAISTCELQKSPACRMYGSSVQQC